MLSHLQRNESLYDSSVKPVMSGRRIATQSRCVSVVLLIIDTKVRSVTSTRNELKLEHNQVFCDESTVSIKQQGKSVNEH